MRKKIKELYSEFQLTEKRAQNILRDSVHEESSCYSLVPLALALMEAVHLYRLFYNSSDSSNLRSLFDGDEVKIPNLDTRLKYIRDLCSASVYGLIKRADIFPSSSSSKNSNKEQSSLGEKFWLEEIEPYTQPVEPKVLSEVARLIDDVFESILSISDNLGDLLKDGREGSWDEIIRHTKHIKDHFDYTEDALIATMRPAEKNDVSDADKKYFSE